MNIRRFSAPTARQALAEVRRVLGGDAIVLANRNLEGGGVEILAMKEQEVGAPPRPAAEPPSQALLNSLVAEVRAMRGEMESRIGRLVWDIEQRDPAVSGTLNHLLRAGFSPALARLLLENMPRRLAPEQALSWTQRALERNLHCAAPDDIVTRGGVYALVGPTGVGKTTTVAKIAARAVVRHGAARVALMTTDGYRVGAHEQLRIYARILGIPVAPVRDAADLERALAENRNRHLVLIDTVGMSQRDRVVPEHLRMLSCAPVERLLLLNAASGADTLEDVALAYRKGGMAGAIVTKLDEAASLGGVLDVAVRHKLRLYYVSNGQRVPEDLHAADERFLVHRALKPAAPRSLFELKRPELAAVMASLPQAAAETAVG